MREQHRQIHKIPLFFKKTTKIPTNPIQSPTSLIENGRLVYFDVYCTIKLSHDDSSLCSKPSDGIGKIILISPIYIFLFIIGIGKLRKVQTNAQAPFTQSCLKSE